MRRRFIFILVGLVLISGVSRREGGVLVHLLTLPAAFVLYPFACLVILAVLAAPFLYGLSLWLLWRWIRDGTLPAWVGRTIRWLRSRRPRGYPRRPERVSGEEPPTTA